MARARLLDEYVSPAVEQMKSIRIIGGQLAAPMFLETHIHKQGLDYQLSASGDLCVLTKTHGRISHNCLALASSAADALMIQLWGESDTASVAQPGATQSDPVRVEKPGSVTLRARTPLFHKFFENLELATESEQGRELMKLIESSCFFGDLCWKNSPGRFRRVTNTATTQNGKFAGDGRDAETAYFRNSAQAT